MKGLNLTLKKKWFDMILSGEKKVEYREIKPYWLSRFTGSVPHASSLSEYLKHWLRGERMTPDFVRFTNGYGKDKPTFLINLIDITIGQGPEIWGAEKGKLYFVLMLGDAIIQVENRRE